MRGYSPDEVRARAQKYAGFEKAGAGLKESFDRYHTQVLEPWIGSKFFSGERPRIGLYLREYPLPCLDGTQGLLPGHAGKTTLPATVMEDSIREVLQGNAAYETIEQALVGCLGIVETTFGVSFARNRSDFVEHVVFADWVRPFAMFENGGGAEFEKEEKLLKRSCHLPEMYKFAGKLLAREVGPNGLGLDIIIVMGLGMFEHAFECLNGYEYEVWPPPSGGKFHTLSGPPDQAWRSSHRRLLVLPHPTAREFHLALERLSLDLESDVVEEQRNTIEALTERLQRIIGPAKIADLPKSNYRSISPPLGRTIFLQLQRGRIILKTTVGDAPQVERWVETQPRLQWKMPEKNNDICIGIPNSVSDRELDALFECLERVL